MSGCHCCGAHHPDACDCDRASGPRCDECGCCWAHCDDARCPACKRALPYSGGVAVLNDDGDADTYCSAACAGGGQA